MRTIGSPQELERCRRLAVCRLLDGYCPQEVAEFLGLHPATVRRWWAAFRRHGAVALAARPTLGRPPLLSATQEKIVRRWLGSNPTEFGFATELWTTQRLAGLIDEEFGVCFHPHYLAAWLRARNYTPQLPRRVPRERDEQAIALWLAQDWPRIKRQARRRRAALVFLDESGLLMAPLRRRSWAERGHPPTLRQKGRHREKVSIAGALWLPPARDRLALAYQTLVNGYFNNEAVAGFLSGAVQWLEGPLTVIWDGGNMHRGGPISALVSEAQGRLVLERLPAYAPELNPVEQVWTWLKYGRLCNYAPRDAGHLNEVVGAELEAIRDDQHCLQNFFHASRLPLPRALFT